jgi:DNA-directed RNA polymerase subunit RPC12/RpoP
MSCPEDADPPDPPPGADQVEAPPADAGSDSAGATPSVPQPFVTRCAACGAETTVTTDQAGKRGRCGVCGGTFLILPPPGFGPLPATGVEAPESPPFDGPPHRASLILNLGLAALGALGVAVVFTSCCPYVPVDLIGVGIGVAATFMGRRDLKAMDRGAMNPAGREKTRLGYALGICAASFGMFMVLLRFGIFAIVILTMLTTAALKPAPPGGFVPPPPTTAPAAQPATSSDEAVDEPAVPLEARDLPR